MGKIIFDFWLSFFPNFLIYKFTKHQYQISFWSSYQMCALIKDVLKHFTKFMENTCVGVSFLIKLQAWALQFFQKETPTHVFSCQCCIIFKVTCLIEQLRETPFTVFVSHISDFLLLIVSYWKDISILTMFTRKRNIVVII